MKTKSIIASLFLLLAQAGYAVDNATVDVVMSIQFIGIEGLKVHDPVSVTAGNEKVIKGRSVFKNTGNGSESFRIKVASTTGDWTLQEGNGSVPTNQYRLRAVWAIYNATVTVADFDDDDILTGTYQGSSDTTFFSNTASESNVGTPEEHGAYDIPQFGLGDNERHLFFRFDAGFTGTTGTSTCYVNVSATPTP